MRLIATSVSVHSEPRSVSGLLFSGWPVKLYSAEYIPRSRNLVFACAEPMFTLGVVRDRVWSDNWTSVTVDGSWRAQFEHTLLITDNGVEILTAP